MSTQRGLASLPNPQLFPLSPSHLLPHTRAFMHHDTNSSPNSKQPFFRPPSLPSQDCTTSNTASFTASFTTSNLPHLLSLYCLFTVSVVDDLPPPTTVHLLGRFIGRFMGRFIGRSFFGIKLRPFVTIPAFFLTLQRMASGSGVPYCPPSALPPSPLHPQPPLSLPPRFNAPRRNRLCICHENPMDDASQLVSQKRRNGVSHLVVLGSLITHEKVVVGKGL